MNPRRSPQTQNPESFPRTVVEDLRRGDLTRTVRRDLRDLYAFYLDEEARERLAGTRWLKRWLLTFGWLAKSLFFNLAPARRILLLVAVIFFVVDDLQMTSGESRISLDTTGLGFVILLVILLLELKDKLLARDELETGRAVQMSLLPTEMPTVPGWDIHLYTRPANDVGGDLVDYLAVRDGRMALVLGDVAGKGLGAALLMAKLQATFRAIATDIHSLAGLGSRLNAIFCRDQVPGRFATLAYLEVAPNSGRVRLLNAGHLPPVLVGKLGVFPMEPQAPPIGLLPETTYREEHRDLEPGDALVVFSDGITEARNAHGDFFGDERLLKLLAGLGARSAQSSVSLILAEVAEFVGDAPIADDLSLIIVRRLS